MQSFGFEAVSLLSCSSSSANDDVSCRSIGREDLESQSSPDPQASPSPTLENRLREQLERLYDRAELHDQGAFEGDKSPPAGTTRDESAEVYTFRLFTRPARSVEHGLANAECQSLQRIALRSPTPVNSEPGFVKPRRPDEYYFTGIPSVRQLEQFRQAAVPGEHILKGLNTIWVIVS